jgi:serine/threonine protein kinase
MIYKIIGRRYKFVKLMGKGSFGVVFISESLESKRKYATKVELSNSKNPKLEKEYQKGKLFENDFGFPEFRYYWSNKQYNALVMEMLGENLEDLHKKCGRRFSIINVAKIALQILSRLELFHKRGFVFYFFFLFFFFFILYINHEYV